MADMTSEEIDLLDELGDHPLAVKISGYSDLVSALQLIYLGYAETGRFNGHLVIQITAFGQSKRKSLQDRVRIEGR